MIRTRSSHIVTASFKRRKSTGSEPLSLLICVNATKFVLPSVFTLKENICPKLCSKSRLKSPKNPFAIGVRRSKTSLFLKTLKGLKVDPVTRPLPVVMRRSYVEKQSFPFVAKHRLLIQQSGGFLVGQAHYSIGRVR